MKAQVITQFGPPSVFTTMDVPLPTLKPGHVLIRVQATSVNPIDCKIRSGLVAALAPEFPAILHGDVAGTIDSISPEITDFKVGDEVYAYAGGTKGLNGALAEYMLVDVQMLAKKPSRLSMAQAAALPVVSITAWEALFTKARLQPGQTILIHGGVGGVGHVAIQLAKWAKAIVYTTVLSNDDIALAKSFGADEVINAKEETVEDYVQRLTNGKGFELVFDTVGGPNIDISLKACAIDGALVTTAARSTHDLSIMHNKGLSLYVVFIINALLTGVGRANYGVILKELANIVDQGQLTPFIDPHLFTIEQVAQAHALLESGQATGKIVLTNN